MNKKAYVSIIIVLIVLVLITGSYTAIHYFFNYSTKEWFRESINAGDYVIVGEEIGDTISGVDVKHGCFDRKLLITAIGSHIIRMVPPLILTEADCDKAYEIIRETVESLSTK